MPDIFKINEANAAVYTLYFRTTTSGNLSTDDILGEGYAGIEDISTFARSGTASTNYYQLRPGITNTTSAASLPSSPTIYGWQWEANNISNWNVGGTWALTFNWQATNANLRGYLNYRITAINANATQLRATLTPWTEEPTLLVPSAANTTQTLPVSAPITSQTLSSQTQYLYIEFYVRPTVGGSGSDGWKFAEETSKIVTAEIFPISGPDATSFINNTDGGLTDGGRPSQQITVSGSSFGSGPCNQDTGNNLVKIGSYIVPCANVSSWGPSSITFTVPPGTGLPDGGSGADGLRIRANGIDDSSALIFWVYPRIVSISPASAEAKQGDAVTLTGDGFYGIAGTVSVNGASAILSTWTDVSISFNVPNGTIDGNIIVTKATPNSKTSNSWVFKILPRITSIASFSTNAGREYDALDSDGLVTLNGDHFRATAGSITILGSAATVGGTWSDTQITNVQIPAAIADNSYSGNIILTRATDSKTNTWPGFYILPRITSLNPNSAAPGTSIQVNGNHFCGPAGTCPNAGSRSTAADNVVFNTTQAPDINITGWTNTQILVNVPAGASTGNVVATSNSYASNGKSFSVVTPIPNAPTDLQQYKSDGITVIAVAGGTAETTLIFKANLSASQNYNLALQVEVSPVATDFDGTGPDVYEGSAVAFSGTPVLGSATATGLTAGTSYHWRARIKNATTGTDYGSWAAFGNNPAGDGTGDGSPANADFYIDQGGPIISSVNAGNLTDSSAQIPW
ncbi:MAG: IPT/TIG domain-containing protein, partial [Patescibacteria group bacterium]